MFNPENPRDIKRLREAVAWSEKRLRKFREQRMAGLRQYVGSHYGEDGARDRVPVNMIELGVNIYQRQVASYSPAALVTTPHDSLKSGAADLELALNCLIRKMQLERALNSAAIDALFSIGVIKVGLAVEGLPAVDGSYLHDPGQPFAEAVLPEDYIVDMSARRDDQVAYEGNRFRVPLDYARDNPQFTQRAREKLSATNKGDNDHAGERGADVHSEKISQGDARGYDEDEIEDQVELIELLLPRHGILLTLAEGDGEPLSITRWQGPKHGCYHKIKFEEVPGNLMPLPPVSLWMDLHDTANRLFNKAVRQSERQKSVLPVPGHAKDDATRTIDTADGEAFLCDHADQLKEVSFGGADQRTIGMFLHSKDLLSYMAGNLDALGGLAAQTGTVGQDKLLASNSSQRVMDMQKKMLGTTKAVVTDLAWYLWNDPLINLPLTKRLAGTEYSIPIQWTPERRMGEYFHYNFEVSPHALTNQSPQERLSALSQFVMQILMPFMPALQESGITLDWEYFIKLFGKYLNLDEINDLITYQAGEAYPERDPVMGGSGGGGEPPAMPQSTTRRYVRENRPAATRQGKDQALAAMLFGGGANGAEMAGMLRPSA